MNPNLNSEDLIFSLDIGTRTIIGMVCKKTASGDIEIIEYAVREHEERNMYDGQIHDIYKVSSVVRDLVEELEDKIKMKLEKVSVAAAGRALKTKKVFIEHETNPEEAITSFNVETLELDAMQKAQKSIDEEGDGVTKYYSIGYSVINYYLDEDKIENLLGHKGSRIGVSILATFLPKIVIDGLNAVIESIGMEITSITLEPIAAINVAIEKDLRLLNLVLVDVGAGTSDIAITKEGQIISYAMTQTAGDEITEAILKEFLLDFNTSENLKRKLGQKKEHKVENILGFEEKYTSSEVLDSIDSVIREIAQDISNSIIERNEKSPDAVFLIGGGSQIPRLKEYIAEKLGLPVNRITIKTLGSIKNLKGGQSIDRPDMITPVGIAAEGLDNKYRNFIDLYLNGKEIQIFNTDNVRVSDILVLAKFDPKELMVKWARDFIYYRNSKRRVIKGKEGTEPLILVNGERASLRTELSHGDEVEIIPSKVTNLEEINIYEVVSPEIDVSNIRANGKEIDEDYMIQYGDEIEIIDEVKEEVVESKKEVPMENMENLRTIYLLVNEEPMTIEFEGEKFIFVDIFDHIDFDRTTVKGELCLKVNGENANYFRELEDGDRLEIYWE